LSKQIDPIKKAKYKISRKRGKSITQSLKDAGYAIGSAEGRNSDLSVVKVGDKEILNELMAKDVTVEWVINKLGTELAAIDAKASDRVRILELLGKWLQMFKDNEAKQTIAIFDGALIEKLRATIPIEPIDIQ